jgi:Fe-S cluster biosynthesis and repair protein YggX
MIYCEKYKEEKEGLDFPPFPGETGQRIFNSISRQAWKDWIGHQTILINEYRLSSLDPKAKAFLAEEMDKFLFGEGSDLPDEFVPQAT